MRAVIALPNWHGRLHVPDRRQNFVTCSNGSLGDPNLAPAGDESVTLLIGARVKARLPFSSKDRVATVVVDPDSTIRESNETNNRANFAYHYD